jgi:hypothetical protein
MSIDFSYTEANRAKVREVAERLVGTCKSANEILTDVFGEEVDFAEFNTKLLQEFDEQCMECEQCGWWTETALLNEECICDECQPPEDDE